MRPQAAAEELRELIQETRGQLEKLALGKLGLRMSAWQVVLWQPRWAFADASAFCYQKVDADDRPIPPVKRIAFTDVKAVEQLEDAEFVLVARKRTFTFKAQNEHQCEILVNNLRQLIRRDRAGAASTQLPITIEGISSRSSRGSRGGGS